MDDRAAVRDIAQAMLAEMPTPKAMRRMRPGAPV
jgi:hypothetical protein